MQEVRCENEGNRKHETLSLKWKNRLINQNWLMFG